MPGDAPDPGDGGCLSVPAPEGCQSTPREARGAEELLGRSARPVQVEAGKAFWWTFAGGRINYTLKYALEVIGGWKVVADNLLLRIEGEG